MWIIRDRIEEIIRMLEHIIKLLEKKGEKLRWKEIIDMLWKVVFHAMQLKEKHGIFYVGNVI